MFNYYYWCYKAFANIRQPNENVLIAFMEIYKIVI